MRTLDDLSPEERQALEEIINEGEEPMEGGGCSVDQIVGAIQMLADQMQLLGEKVDLLEKLVQDEIIGGITKLYHKNQKLMRVDGLREKLGEYSGIGEAFGKAFPREDGSPRDIYEAIDEMLEGERGSEGFDEMASAKSKAEMIKAKLAEIAKAMGPGSSLEAEVKVEPELSEEDRVVRDIEDMRKRGKI